jgi:hypothetical protein
MHRTDPAAASVTACRSLASLRPARVLVTGAGGEGGDGGAGGAGAGSGSAGVPGARREGNRDRGRGGEQFPPAVRGH